MSLRNISPEGENNTEFIVEFQFISGFNGAVEKTMFNFAAGENV